MVDLVRLYVTVSGDDRTIAAHDQRDHAAVQRALVAFIGLENFNPVVRWLPSVRRAMRTRARAASPPVGGRPKGTDARDAGRETDRGDPTPGDEALRKRAAEPAHRQVVIGLDPLPDREIRRLKGHLAANLERLGGVRIAADLPIAPADTWIPATAASPLFGKLDRALAMIGKANLTALGAEGQGVNVIIVDQGIAASYLPALNIMTGTQVNGWPVDPGELGTSEEESIREPGQAPFGHGTRMAQLVLAVAPQAKIYDLPLLPHRIRELSAFLHDAGDAFVADGPVQEAIGGSGKWVLCNAWSVYDLSGDAPPGASESYEQNPDHHFTALMEALTSGTDQPHFADAVFAAGNFAAFSAPTTAAAPDRPGRAAASMASPPCHPS